MKLIVKLSKLSLIAFFIFLLFIWVIYSFSLLSYPENARQIGSSEEEIAKLESEVFVTWTFNFLIFGATIFFLFFKRLRIVEKVKSLFNKIPNFTLPQLGFLFLLCLLISWFYWFQFRPSQIKERCAKLTLEAVSRTAEALYNSNTAAVMDKYGNSIYQNCLHSKGL